MKSYASIDRIEGNYAVCELEMIGIQESMKIALGTRETIMIDIPVFQIYKIIGKQPEEGDVIVVEHEDSTIKQICYEDTYEKTKRIEQIIAIMQT